MSENHMQFILTIRRIVIPEVISIVDRTVRSLHQFTRRFCPTVEILAPMITRHYRTGTVLIVNRSLIHVRHLQILLHLNIYLLTTAQRRWLTVIPAILVQHRWSAWPRHPIVTAATPSLIDCSLGTAFIKQRGDFMGFRAEKDFQYLLECGCQSVH